MFYIKTQNKKYQLIYLKCCYIFRCLELFNSFPYIYNLLHTVTQFNFQTWHLTKIRWWWKLQSFKFNFFSLISHLISITSCFLRNSWNIYWRAWHFVVIWYLINITCYTIFLVWLCVFLFYLWTKIRGNCTSLHSENIWYLCLTDLTAAVGKRYFTNILN